MALVHSKGLSPDAVGSVGMPVTAFLVALGFFGWASADAEFLGSQLHLGPWSLSQRRYGTAAGQLHLLDLINLGGPGPGQVQQLVHRRPAWAAERPPSCRLAMGKCENPY